MASIVFCWRPCITNSSLLWWVLCWVDWDIVQNTTKFEHSIAQLLISSQKITLDFILSIWYLYVMQVQLSDVDSQRCWNLFRPPSPAAAGRVGLYILLLYFIFFDNRPYSRESARQPPAGTTKRTSQLAMHIKYPQTFDPRCPLFYRGQMH